MFLINGCYLSFWSDRWLTDGNNSIGATHNRSEKTCTKSVGRNILRWNVEAEQIGGIHIATKVHSIAWKAYWNLQRKVLAYIALNTWWKLKKKREERSFKSVWTNLQATKRYYAPKTPPTPHHDRCMNSTYISAQLLHDVQNKRQTKRKWEWKTGCWHSEKQRIRCKNNTKWL